eukprot:scaffold200511_cov29-Tisochrysis_lutea.AAC.5
MKAWTLDSASLQTARTMVRTAVRTIRSSCVQSVRAASKSANRAGGGGESPSESDGSELNVGGGVLLVEAPAMGRSPTAVEEALSARAPVD